MTTHGMSNTRTYRIYQNMRNRCRNPKFTSYKWYGARGIDFTDDWNTFEAFLTDMGPCPDDSHSLERLEGHLGYSKSNCVWATRIVQANNKRDNIVMTAFGRTQTLMTWSRELGIHPARIRMRRRRGGSDTHALSKD